MWCSGWFSYSIYHGVVGPIQYPILIFDPLIIICLLESNLSTTLPQPSQPLQNSPSHSLLTIGSTIPVPTIRCICSKQRDCLSPAYLSPSKLYWVINHALGQGIREAAAPETIRGDIIKSKITYFRLHFLNNEILLPNLPIRKVTQI